MNNIENLKQEIIKRSGNDELTEKQALEFILLQDALTMYAAAQDNIESHGLTMSFNSGKTFGLNPCIKVKNDATKLIIRLLKTLYAKVDDEVDEDDGYDFIENLCKPSKLPIY